MTDGHERLWPDYGGPDSADNKEQTSCNELLLGQCDAQWILQANVANTQGTAFLKPNYLRNVNYDNGNEDVETYPGLNPWAAVAHFSKSSLKSC